MSSEKLEVIHEKCPLTETDTTRELLAELANMKFRMIYSSVLELRANRRLDFGRRGGLGRRMIEIRSPRGLRSRLKSQTSRI